jgi:hypothetical protein
MANDWKEAPSKTERTRIFKETGVRWSELLRLPYWDPTRFIVVDAMHNIFLNLVKYHIETVLGIRQVGKPEKGAEFPPATPEEMAQARKVMEKGVKKKSQLKKIKIPGLLALCEENDIRLPRPQEGRIKRATIVDALFVSPSHGVEEY